MTQRERARESLCSVQWKERDFCDTSFAGLPLPRETKPFCLAYVQQGRKLGSFLIYEVVADNLVSTGDRSPASKNTDPRNTWESFNSRFVCVQDCAAPQDGASRRTCRLTSCTAGAVSLARKSTSGPASWVHLFQAIWTQGFGRRPGSDRNDQLPRSADLPVLSPQPLPAACLLSRTAGISNVSFERHTSSLSRSSIALLSRHRSSSVLFI